MSPRSTVLGVDLATADARVIAIDAGDGRLLAEATHPLAVVFGDDGTREQTADYAAIVLELIAAVTHALGVRAADIAALSITGTSGTVVPADADGSQAGAALLYNDPRGKVELGALVDAGLSVRPSGALARAAWLHRNRRAERYAYTPDIVAAALARHAVASDTSHALKSGIDPVTRAWDERALEIVGLPRATLGALVAPGGLLGTVHDAVAARVGLPRDVAIIAGMTDGCTSQLATGAVAPGDTVGVLGTTLVLKAVSSVEVADAASGIYSHVAPDGAYWAGGASNVGAGSLALGMTAGLDVRDADRLAAQVGPASAVSYPLPARGERFPVASGDLAEFVIGLDGGPAIINEPIERYRMLLEGVAFVERLGLERLRALGVPAGRHRLSGGASGSPVWNRIRATVLGETVEVPATRTSAHGAAVLAAYGALGGSLADTCAALTRADASVDPIATEESALDDRYRAFTGKLAELGLG